MLPKGYKLKFNVYNNRIHSVLCIGECVQLGVCYFCICKQEKNKKEIRKHFYKLSIKMNITKKTNVQMDNRKIILEHLLGGQ